jgi:hypothetical protein
LYASREAEHRSLLSRIVGLVFLGTPFRGTKWQPLLDSLTKLMAPAGSHDGIVRDLGYDDARLRDRIHYFCRLCNELSMPVSCFYELHDTDVGRRSGVSGVMKGIVRGNAAITES